LRELLRDGRDFRIFRDEGERLVDTETAAEASREGTSPKRRDRCVQRTVDLSEREIAAVAAAEMTPPAEPRHGPTEAQANT
jgi:hypothetical protein